MTAVLQGCTCTPLSDASGDQLIAWARGEGEPPTDIGTVDWLLAHCDSGVVWGHRRSGSWSLSTTAFPAVSPSLLAAAVQELRMFGPEEELLLWRDEGRMAGRRLRESTEDSDEDARPLDDFRVLLGTRVVSDPQQGFTLVTDEGGSRQAVPVELGRDDLGRHSWLRLRLRHYLERSADPDTEGVLRVAASRLVDITRESLPLPGTQT